MPEAKPKCPACGTAKQVHAVGSCGDMFKCGRCGGLFDQDPDEGGSHSNFNPGARIEREERRLETHRQRR